MSRRSDAIALTQSGGQHAAIMDGPDAPSQAFVRVDVSEDAVVDAWFCGERRFTDDAVLAATGKDETDAYLVAPVYDAATQRSTIVVLDCADLAAGPVCELALPDDAPFVPWGLHGAWSPS